MMIEDLFENEIVKLAEQPKNNNLSVDRLNYLNLLIIPIDHDYPGGSAAMHNAVFERYGLPYRTVFVVADPKNVEMIIKTFRNDPKYIGGGVGSGFKDKAAKYVDELSDSAKVLESINVIQKIGRRLIGYNTDGIGFVNGLSKEYPDCVKGKNILILGAGGTTLPIAYELAMLKPREIVILNRTVEKAERVSKIISQYVKARCGGEEMIEREMPGADIVINTSNKGAGELKEFTAFAAISDNHMRIARENLRRLGKNAIVADILLEEETATLREAKKMQFRTHNGRLMNLFQAIPAFKLMTGITDISDKHLEEIMRSAL